jgi:hypothetical protein
MNSDVSVADDVRRLYDQLGPGEQQKLLQEWLCRFLKGVEAERTICDHNGETVGYFLPANVRHRLQAQLQELTRRPEATPPVRYTTEQVMAKLMQIDTLTASSGPTRRTSAGRSCMSITHPCATT